MNDVDTHFDNTGCDSSGHPEWCLGEALAGMQEQHFGCPDCGEQDGCQCRWKDAV